MQDMIFKKNTFSSTALEILKLSQYIADAYGSEKVSCAHLLAAVSHLAPQAAADVLGKNISDWQEKYKIDSYPIESNENMPAYSDELCVLLLDATEDTPMNSIKELFPEQPLGAVDLAYILLKEPTEEIIDMLSRYDVTNDAVEYGEQLFFNYLSCREKHSGFSPRERLKQCVEMGKKFSAYMNERITGQEKAIEQLCTLLVNFWYSGNNRLPLSILLLSRAGGGRSFFARTMQEAFVELGLQKSVYSPLDMSSFTNTEAATAELCGHNRSYKEAAPGLLYDNSRKNRRGMMVFENIELGCESANKVLCALTRNAVHNKFFEKNLQMPMNVLVFTRALSATQYSFLEQNVSGNPDAAHLTEILNSKEAGQNKNSGNEAGLINSVSDIIILAETDEKCLKKMAQHELDKLESYLQKEYQVSLNFRNKEDLIELLLQSSPHTLTPKELVAAVSRHLSGLSRSAVRHPEMENIEIICGKLPDYPHDISRRTLRGDYLVFDRHERCDGKRYICEFNKIKYVTQQSIDCGAYKIERPKNLSLNDIVGLDDLILELQDSLDFVTGKYKDANIPPPALNYILAGAPGTGKTATITALASHCDIPVFFANSSIYADAAKLDDLFVKAGKTSPCLVIFDEFDSIGSRESTPWRRDAVNSMLAHMDGCAETAKMVILASTNHPEVIDPALRRPGRFSRVIKVGLPSSDAREQYIRKFEQKYSFKLAEKDRDFLVDLTDNKTIAVLKSVMELGLRSSIRSGKMLNSDALEKAYNHIVSKENNSCRRVIGFMEGNNI